MSTSSFLRVFIAAVVVLGFLAVLLLGLVTADLFLSVWERLEKLPLWLSLTAAGIGLGFSSVAGWLLFRLLRGDKQGPTARPEPPPPPTEEQLAERVQQADSLGVDTAEARAELEQLKRRRSAGEIHIALFGEISSGKSSLIQALLPGAETQVGVSGGTTRAIHQFQWQSPAGDRLVVSDMPGLSEVGRGLDELARDEALRAHGVIYLCDGDLTRDQWAELQLLLELQKPLILAVNKIDRLNAEQQAQVLGRLRERFQDSSTVQVIAISAGGRREALRILPDGREELVMRPIPPRIEALQQAIQRIIDRDPQALEKLRDSAVFVLTARQLDRALADKRRERAAQTVTSYSRKAMAGAMAAMAPGADLLIQGYLGTQMVRQLAEIYNIPVRQVDTDLLLELAQKYVRKSTTLILAIAGNGLKAFPGVGTLAGGVLHAIAYGMLFDALGRAIAGSLESRGELHPVQAAAQFKDNLGDNLEGSARRFAEIALVELRERKGER